MSLAELANALPGYAEDAKRNLSALLAETHLSEQQKWGCLLACAYAAGETGVVGPLERAVAERLSAEAKLAVKQAVAVMAMNTVYYGAVNSLHNHEYRAEPVNLSMSALTNPGVDKIDFELWALAVSAIHGCSACLDAHETELRKRGVSLERIHAAIRIAAVVNAMSQTMRMEAAQAKPAA